METFRKTIKKIAAIGSGALIAATCFGVAGLATDLSSYPAPFVANGKWVGLIAVGADAATADVIGAVDVATTLAQNVGTTGVSTTVSGGKAQNLYLNQTLNNGIGSPLTATDLAGFQDTSVTIDTGNSSKTYNVKDTLTFGSASPKITTGLTEGSTAKEWGKDIWMTVSSSGKISYNYVFKTSLNVGNFISSASNNNPITINFLGKDLKITGYSGNNTITAQIATEYYMNYGDTVTVEGHAVKLINVGSGTNPAVIVSVDGTQGTVAGTGTTKISGIRFSVHSAFSSDTPAERAASLYIGTDVSKSYTNGDPYIGQDTSNPDWTWNLTGIDTATPTIGITNAKAMVSPAGTWKPIKAGDKLDGPNGFFSISVGDPTTSSYKDYTYSLSTEDLYYDNNTLASSAKNVLTISASGGQKNGFKIGSSYTDKLAIYYDSTSTNTTVFWQNSDQGNHFQNSSTVLNTTGTAGIVGAILTPDYTNGLTLYITGAAGKLNITTGADQNITQCIGNITGGSIDRLGSVVGTATAGDLYVLAPATDVSTLDADGRTKDGIIINSIKSNGDSDQLKLTIPSKVSTQFTVATTVSSTGTKMTASGVAGSLASVPVAKTDTEITDPKAQNLILVGGTAVNKLTAQALGVTYPTHGTAAGTAMSIGENEGTLKLVENAFGGTNVALIVAGWEAADTRNAANVLKDYTAYSATLIGKQVVVKSTAGTITLSAPVVAAPIVPIVPAANTTV